MIGSLFGALGVIVGAFGAHALKAKLSVDQLAIYDTGARYHLIHALALIAVSFASTKWPHGLAKIAGWFFVAGIILFSGSLYLLSITGIKILGAITPFGGLALIIGWLLLAYTAFKRV